MPAPSQRSNRSRMAFVTLTLWLFALSFGYLLNLAFAQYRPPLEYPQWHGALPVTTASATALGYFRRPFTLASVPKKAYLVISGTDDLAVYVNGSLAGTSRYFGARTSEIMDLTRFMQRGKNVLAVALDSNAPDAICELTARLELWLPDGSRKTIPTDTSWRARGVEEYDSYRHAVWYAPEFTDLHWPRVRVKEMPDGRPLHPYRVPESIMQHFPEGHWIGRLSGNKRNAAFLRDFQVPPGRINGAWLGVSAAGNYTITLNDRFLYSQAGSLRSMELFDIGPYVKQGANRLFIQVDSDLSWPRLAVSGLIQSTAGEVEFSSDGRWRTLETERMDQASSSYGTVLVMENLRSASDDTSLTLNFNEIEAPIELVLLDVLSFGGFASMLFLVLVSGLLLLHLSVRRVEPLPFWQDLETLAIPFLLGTVLSLLLLVVSLDIRSDARSLVQPRVLAAIGAIVLAWEAFIILERIGRGRTADG